MIAPVSLLLLLLLLTAKSAALTNSNRLIRVPVYPWNSSRIDLSNRNLFDHVILTLYPEPRATTTTTTTTSSPNADSVREDYRQDEEVLIDLIDFSGNPSLLGFSFDTSFKETFVYVNIKQLNFSGTLMAPLTGRMYKPLDASSPNGLRVTVTELIANGTALREPLDLNLATEYMYGLSAVKFSLIGWQLKEENRLPASFTSQKDAHCNSKNIKSLSINRLHSTDGVELIGNGPDRIDSKLTVHGTIDLSSNRLKRVANVTFEAGRVDLSNNRLIDLPNVIFIPGSVCGKSLTGQPTLILKLNQLRPRVLHQLTDQRFTGLDLSDNPALLEATKTESPIFVSDFLDLSGLWGEESQLSSLLSRFRRFNGSESTGSVASRFRLSLADNWLPNLASAADLVDDFARNGEVNQSIHLDVSGNPRLVHLNLSDLPTTLVATLTARRLPHLHSASVRVDGDGAAAAMERLRRSGQRPGIADLISLWSRQGGTLLLDAQPSDCCLRADASELVCSFDAHSVEAVGRSSRTRSRRGSVFCYGDGVDSDNFDGYGYGYGRLPHPPELPLLFSCAVLGGALLLGVITGIAFFYARRRARGRYAVYSVYDVDKLKSLQQQQQQQQHQKLASVGVNRGAAGNPVLLKAVSVVHLPTTEGSQTTICTATEV